MKTPSENPFNIPTPEEVAVSDLRHAEGLAAPVVTNLVSQLHRIEPGAKAWTRVEDHLHPDVAAIAARAFTNRGWEATWEAGNGHSEVQVTKVRVSAT